MLHIVKPAVCGARPASVSVNFWQVGGAEDSPSQVSRQVIRAELRGDGFRLVSALWDALNHPSRFATPQSTIDAVMYSLRGGAAVLSRDDVQRRLAVIDETQLLKMIDLLQKRDGKIAPRWSDDEVEQLMQTWTACHG
jgi:hypothetical protein